MSDPTEWTQQYQAEYQWLSANAKSFDFAHSLTVWLGKHGSLTEKQLAAVQKCMSKAKPAPQAAQEVDVEAIEYAFEKAVSKGIKRPKLRLGSLVFSPAPATGKNAGAIYVVGKNKVYLGKVQQGAFKASFECTPEMADRVVQCASDPHAAAVAYGKKYGQCAVCGRTLTDAKSVELGIGPICKEAFF